MIGATLFSGGRGAEARLTDLIDFRYAVEYDPQIAAVGAQLGGHTFVNRVEDVDYSLWGALDYLHASPVCKEYSQAKAGGAEGESDLSSAAAVVRCLEATTPRVFTLENVGAYQHGQAYRRICQALDRMGYMWHAEVLNAADYGVPQTRRRLILRAVRDSLLPGLPPPVKWVGWYAALQNELVESAPTPYQLRRAKTACKQVPVLVDTNNDSRPATVRQAHEPASSIPSSWYRRRAPQGVWFAHGRRGHITPRNAATLQSVPHWYCLPDDPRLAGEIVGNMAPPLLMREIVRPLL